MRRAACFLRRGNLIEDTIVITGQKNSAINYHVDLIRAVARCAPYFLQFQSQRHQAGRKRRCDRRHFDARIGEKLFCDSHQGWVNANCRAGRHFVTSLERLHRFAAKKRDFARRVFAFQGRQIHHRDGELKASQFGGRFDAAPGERYSAFFDHDLIDRRKFPSPIRGLLRVNPAD